MTPKVRAFWDETREELRALYGQTPGQRDRDVLERRKHLADQLGVDHKTLKAFLNGRQIGLGPLALNRLLTMDSRINAKYAALERNGVPDTQLKFDF